MSGTLDLLNSVRLAFYDNLPTALIVQGTAQSFPTSGTDATLILDTVVSDNWTGWSAGSPTRYTVQVPGLYALNANITWAGNATGRRITYIKANGTNIPGSAGDLASPLTNNIAIPTPTVLFQANAGDFFEVVGNQTSGGALSTNGAGAGSSFIPSLTVQWLHT